MNKFHITVLISFLPITSAAYKRPNIILMMADDLGWGEVGYHGTNNEIKTPNLDDMAANGLEFERFYAGSSVCSPTRASALTGRSPIKVGVPNANAGHVPKEEITIGEAVKAMGYTTGHFGKWHMGSIDPSNSGGGSYSPPWEHGFDVCLSTRAKVPTWDPLGDVSKDPFGDVQGMSPYFNCKPEKVPNLKGDDSRVMMDAVIPFIEGAVAEDKPFLALVWFHAPHKPYIAGPEYKAMYSNLSDEKQHYYGCITAMDDQIGRLREELDRLGVRENTMLWFTSDNGPEGGTPGTTGGLRDRKRSMHEGGIRVPGLLEWPEVITDGRETSYPGHTSDYYATTLDAIGFRLQSQTSLMDSHSLLPLIMGEPGEEEKRTAPMNNRREQQVMHMQGDYKIYSNNNGSSWQMYNIANDRGENNDIKNQNQALFNQMVADFEKWDKAPTVYAEECCTAQVTKKHGCMVQGDNNYDADAEIHVEDMCESEGGTRVELPGRKNLSTDHMLNPPVRFYDMAGRYIPDINHESVRSGAYLMKQGTSTLRVIKK